MVCPPFFICQAEQKIAQLKKPIIFLMAVFPLCKITSRIVNGNKAQTQQIEVDKACGEFKFHYR